MDSSHDIDESSTADRRRVTGYVLASLGVVAITALAQPLRKLVEPTNLVMLYLLLVVGIGIRFSRGAAAWCALFSVLAFDFFVIPPRLSFAVGDIQYVLTFVVMLCVGLLLAHLTDGLRKQAIVAARRERDTSRLYELAREFSGSVDVAQVADQLVTYFRAEMGGVAELWWAESGGSVSRVVLPWVDDEGKSLQPSPLDEKALRIVVETVIREGKAHESNDLAAPGWRCLLVPLDAPMRRRGVLVANVPAARLDSARSQISAIAVLVAIALERLHYVKVAQRATVSMERERLRNTILSALSHDIRTPLTIMVGQADALLDLADPASDKGRDLMAGIREQSLRMNELVNNLLDMARLQSGETVPRIEWQSVEELVGAAVAHLGDRLDTHRLELSIPPEMGLVEFDAVLMERVLCNLLENALKFSPAGSRIRVTSEETEKSILIRVEDEGPGLSQETAERLFAPFVRGPASLNVPGLGLGLSICRIIVEAHKGGITAINRPEGGASFVIRLPRSTPPMIESEEQE